MRHASLSVSFALLLGSPLLWAEETPPAPAASNPPLAAATAAEALVDELEQRLAESERLRQELEATISERESSQLARLRQENQRLRLQLKEAQAQQPPPLLDERQRWLAIGGGIALGGVILGALLRGRRRSRREWIN
ncbi:hypothetical protein [Pseudomonas indica]|uniref:Translation initiation factor 2 n=1 Tax=Pseudomonas indica TaxID=137658 RepID=A0A1G8YMG9_9PSED|nr:hypothetical protein [Pseudomonas indica]MBU3057123.1 translation initiation factor 2 [Pseudomonas indica]PAU62113.1 hypothetical protein BZL42_07095 [Pseudomonas indica]SDK03325.1 hypothetical protein SAMN05216186_10432 [Pseudomonas indica]